MRFLIDAQLPPALARWLAANGHEAEHVADFGVDGTTDQVIWQRALATQAVIVLSLASFVTVYDPLWA